MEVVLTKDVENLGRAGQVVTVKDGVGRNYLIPQNLAVRATPKNVKQFEHRKRVVAAKVEKLRREAAAAAERLSDYACTVSRNAGDDDRLFGSVSAKDVAAVLADDGIDVARRQIDLPRPIKRLGIYVVDVRLHADMVASIRVWVCAKNGVPAADMARTMGESRAYDGPPSRRRAAESQAARALSDALTSSGGSALGDATARGRAAPAPQLRWDDGGRLDLDALERSVSRSLMERWLGLRLAGQDPWLASDEDALEHPEDVFVDLWRRSDPRGALRDSLDAACAALLPDALVAGAAPRARALLRLIAAVQPPACRTFLVRVVRDADVVLAAGRPAAEIDREWLAAAAAYRPQPVELVTVWPKLLTRERFRIVAYHALSQDLETGLLHLPAYFAALPAAKRPRFLRQAVRRLMDDERGPTFALSRIRTAQPRLAAVPELPTAVDDALDALGLPRAFQRGDARELEQDVATDPGGRRRSDRGREPSRRSVAGRDGDDDRRRSRSGQAVEFRPLEVPVINGNLEGAIRALKRKMNREGILKQLKLKLFRERPSVARKRARKDAARRRRRLLRRLSRRLPQRDR